MSSSGLLGALTVNTHGNEGVDCNRNGAHAGGGGGAAGVAFTSAAATIATQGGILCITSAVDSPPDGPRRGASNDVGGVDTAAIAATTAVPASTSPGASCLPVLTVANSTTTPLHRTRQHRREVCANCQHAATADEAYGVWRMAYGVALRGVLPVSFVLQDAAATATKA